MPRRRAVSRTDLTVKTRPTVTPTQNRRMLLNINVNSALQRGHASRETGPLCIPRLPNNINAVNHSGVGSRLGALSHRKR